MTWSIEVKKPTNSGDKNPLGTWELVKGKYRKEEHARDAIATMQDECRFPEGTKFRVVVTRKDVF